jgi:hypothetical protein
MVERKAFPLWLMLRRVKIDGSMWGDEPDVGWWWVLLESNRVRPCGFA